MTLTGSGFGDGSKSDSYLSAASGEISCCLERPFAILYFGTLDYYDRITVRGKCKIGRLCELEATDSDNRSP
jgi:hypothetical protein